METAATETWRVGERWAILDQNRIDADGEMDEHTNRCSPACRCKISRTHAARSMAQVASGSTPGLNLPPLSSSDPKIARSQPKANSAQIWRICPTTALFRENVGL